MSMSDRIDPGPGWRLLKEGERISWDVRLSKPLSDGGATICEKHDFALANYADPSMTWEVRQALTQAKDDGERMERRIQDLGEEANNLEECLDAAETEIVRLKIAHLWRVVEVIHFKYRAGLCKRHQTNRIDRLQSACLAKITELKESQCSTKP